MGYCKIPGLPDAVSGTRGGWAEVAGTARLVGSEEGAEALDEVLRAPPMGPVATGPALRARPMEDMAHPSPAPLHVALLPIAFYKHTTSQ